jgi:hypothetical protein
MKLLQINILQSHILNRSDRKRLPGASQNQGRNLISEIDTGRSKYMMTFALLFTLGEFKYTNFTNRYNIRFMRCLTPSRKNIQNN